MEKEYIRDFFISYTDVDTKLQLSLVSSVCLLQNMMTEYFTNLKSDNIILREKNNAAWVVVKTKIHFNQYPNFKDMIKGNSFTTKIKPIRVETETQFRNNNDEILFYAEQESCVIDLETRKIRKVDTVNYPMNLETRNSMDDTAYSKLIEDFSEVDKVYEQVVYSTDIDYSKHMNNVFYVRYIMNSLSCDFLSNNKITDFEIHYINESKEGQLLKIYKKEREGKIEFLIKEKERKIVRACLNYTSLG